MSAPKGFRVQFAAERECERDYTKLSEVSGVLAAELERASQLRGSHAAG